METIITIAIVLYVVVILAVAFKGAYTLGIKEAQKQDKPKVDDVCPEPVVSSFRGRDGQAYGRVVYKGHSYITNTGIVWYREPDFVTVNSYDYYLETKLESLWRGYVMRIKVNGQ